MEGFREVDSEQVAGSENKLDKHGECKGVRVPVDFGGFECVFRRRVDRGGVERSVSKNEKQINLLISCIYFLI